MGGAMARRDESELSVSVAAELPAIFQLAKALTQARGFIPSYLKSEGEIAAVILAGRELGLPPMTSLRSVFLVNGKVGLDASMQLALMKRAGIRHEWLADGSDCKFARLKVERNGEAPYEQVYSIDDAKRAGLAGNGSWQKHTPAMLRARCVSAAARAYAPDVLSGVYAPDEIDEMRGAYAGGTMHSIGSAMPSELRRPPEVTDQHQPDLVETEKHSDPEAGPHHDDESGLTPADEVRMLVEVDLDRCTSRESLVTWAQCLLGVRMPSRDKLHAWKAFETKVMLLDPKMLPRELVNEAKGVAA